MSEIRVDTIKDSAGTGGSSIYLGGAAAANLLEDYEEGTFTPTIEGTTTAGVGTYVTQNGRYTKIGDIVNFDIFVEISAHTGTGNINVSGLPYVQNGTYLGNIIVGFATNLTFSGQLGGHVLTSTNDIRLKVFSSASAGGNVAMDTAFAIYISGTYGV